MISEFGRLDPCGQKAIAFVDPQFLFARPLIYIYYTEKELWLSMKVVPKGT
jgi:hypothetical protein